MGRLDLDISGSARADPQPIRYWGGNDFSGGVLVAKIGGKAKVGPAGGKIPGLTAITFTGGPFGTVSFPFINGLSGSISGCGKGASAEVGIGMGVGGSIGLGETEVTPPPELREERRVATSFLTWTLNVGPFETGKADPPEKSREWLHGLREHLEDWKRR